MVPRTGGAAAERAVGQAIPDQRQRQRQVVTIFPGACTARGARHRASPAGRPRPRPVTQTASSGSNVPAWETSPWPSADTVILGQRTVFFTWKVPSARRRQILQQVLSSQAKALFR